MTCCGGLLEGIMEILILGTSTPLAPTGAQEVTL